MAEGCAVAVAGESVEQAGKVKSREWGRRSQCLLSHLQMVELQVPVGDLLAAAFCSQLGGSGSG